MTDLILASEWKAGAYKPLSAAQFAIVLRKNCQSNELTKKARKLKLKWLVFQSRWELAVLKASQFKEKNVL